MARAAFDSALARENAGIRREVENMLQRSSEPSAAWDILEFHATKQREIERKWKYDYRSSVLTGVFGSLLAEGWIMNRPCRAGR